ncbi:MAG TPA: Flp family type IVb pilin [Candidatus Aphodocola excrementigallinarum]|uniref:Flp family type IVb pilin n=1 Tax=Candidatus Aphodocola excrementigallinarum TaxID=2840670 RepID=A0A9D1LIC3_9FIRM|nr:Flp family type IVb pilin [Candidatus Aphodocola excrementigallinarum]
MLKLNKKGQALVEYVLIIALVTVIAVSLIRIFGGYLKDSITKTSCELVGETYQEGSEPGEGTCK